MRRARFPGTGASEPSLGKEMVNKHYDVLVFEDLTDIRKKRKNEELDRDLGTWSFHQLQSFVEYKGEALGKKVVVIDPAIRPRRAQDAVIFRRAIGRRGGSDASSACSHWMRTRTPRGTSLISAHPG